MHAYACMPRSMMPFSPILKYSHPPAYETSRPPPRLCSKLVSDAVAVIPPASRSLKTCNRFDEAPPPGFDLWLT